MAKKTTARGARSQAIRDYLTQHAGASTKDVVAALKEQGIAVTDGLVNNIKYSKKSKPIRRRGARTAPANGTADQPASQAGVSRSQSIRDYLRDHPQATPKEIVAGLAEQGIEVSLGLASLVKYKKASPRRERIGRRTARARGPGTGGSLSAASLMEAKRLADNLGGIANAKQALDLLEQLR